MATKDNPGEFDCYKALANDEPYFLLRANDPCAPQIVLMWARLYIERKMMDREGSDPEKVFAKYDEATTVAEAMELWHETRLLPCTKCGLPRNDHRDDEVAHRWTAEQQEAPMAAPTPVLDRQRKDAQDNGDRPNDAAIGTSLYG